MEEKRLRIGELLIEAGVLSHDKLREALAIQKQNRSPLGRILVEAAFVTEAQLIQALSRQLAIPWVSLWHVDVAPELLAVVSREDAERLGLLPIYARTVRGERPALFVAMEDPTNQDAIALVREAAGMEVRPMIAAPSDLRQAIRALYTGEEEDEEDEAPPAPPLVPHRSSPPPPPPSPRAPRRPPPVRGADEALLLTDEAGEEPPPEDEAAGEGTEGEEEAPAPSEAGEPAPDAEAPAESDLVAGLEAARDSRVPPPDETAPADLDPSAPTFLVPGSIEGGAPVAAIDPAARRRARRALAFTFLDGTSIAFGEPARADHGPGAVSLPELIGALRRYADDPGVPEPCGPRGLSRVVAAILEILSRRGVISERELAEAIERHWSGT